jgi:inorganic pyrophosphatase
MSSRRADDILPGEAEVVIDQPRFSHVKRRDDGAIDFVSPLPCPFNYGSVPDTRSGDGDRIDAVVLGPRLPRGSRKRVPVLGVVRFVDAGAPDPKWICAERPLSVRDLWVIGAFFRLYAIAKRVLNWLRGRSGATRFEGLELARGDDGRA